MTAMSPPLARCLPVVIRVPIVRVRDPEAKRESDEAEPRQSSDGGEQHAQTVRLPAGQAAEQLRVQGPARNYGRQEPAVRLHRVLALGREPGLNKQELRKYRRRPCLGLHCPRGQHECERNHDRHHVQWIDAR